MKYLMKNCLDATDPIYKTELEITENGTVEVLPDNGYVLSKVGVTVNVSAAEQTVEQWTLTLMDDTVVTKDVIVG